jgi:hypothetical protein
MHSNIITDKLTASGKTLASMRGDGAYENQVTSVATAINVAAHRTNNAMRRRGARIGTVEGWVLTAESGIATRTIGGGLYKFSGTNNPCVRRYYPADVSANDSSRSVLSIAVAFSAQALCALQCEVQLRL